MSKNSITFLELKKKFPILNQNCHQKLIYFDSASTAQMPDEVIQAMTDYYSQYKANVGRGLYTIAEQATLAYEQARETIAQYINASSADIVFTSGTTDGINLVIASFAENCLGSGDEIIISDIEHHSNFVPWIQLAQRKKCLLTILPVNDHGVIDPVVLQQKISDRTKLVAFFHISNVTGACNDVVALTDIAHQAGAKILIDAAQSIAHQTIDIRQIKPDFLVFSGHKLFGPTGVGVLYVAPKVQVELQNVHFGGGMVYSATFNQVLVKPFPHGFESGTPNIAGVIGLGAAMNFVRKNIDLNQLSIHETRLAQTLINALKNIEHMRIVSVTDFDQHLNMVTFYSTKYHAHDIAAYCNEFGIAVRAGNHCVQPWHEKQNLNASVRVSFSVYNTIDEVTFLIEKLQAL